FCSAHLPLTSFPTRRSSDLGPGVHRRRLRRAAPPAAPCPGTLKHQRAHRLKRWARPACRKSGKAAFSRKATWRKGFVFLRKSHRSEEHTSELQSRFDLVCRL